MVSIWSAPLQVILDSVLHHKVVSIWSALTTGYFRLHVAVLHHKVVSIGSKVIIFTMQKERHITAWALIINTANTVVVCTAANGTTVNCTRAKVYSHVHLVPPEVKCTKHSDLLTG